MELADELGQRPGKSDSGRRNGWNTRNERRGSRSSFKFDGGQRNTPPLASGFLFRQGTEYVDRAARKRRRVPSRKYRLLLAGYRHVVQEAGLRFASLVCL